MAADVGAGGGAGPTDGVGRGCQQRERGGGGSSRAERGVKGEAAVQLNSRVPCAWPVRGSTNSGNCWPTAVSRIPRAKRLAESCRLAAFRASAAG